jgi:cellulose biosynthesis protein BcsQ
MTTLDGLPGPRRELAPLRPGGPFVISVWGGKGGICKTTSAVELAQGLGSIGRTLLVNADMKQEDGGSSELYSLLENPPFELMESDDPVELSKLRLLTQFRYVITDNAPHRDEAKLRAAAAGDLVIVPMLIEHLPIRAVMSSIRLHLQPIGAPYKVLLTRVEHGRRNKAKLLQETMAGLGMPYYKTTMRKYDAHQDAGSSGVPILEGDGSNWDKAAQDVRAYVDETLATLNEPYRMALSAAAEASTVTAS